MHALLAAFRSDRRFELTIKARTHQGYAMPLFRAAISEIKGEVKLGDSVLTFARLVAINICALDKLVNRWYPHQSILGFFPSNCPSRLGRECARSVSRLCPRTFPDLLLPRRAGRSDSLWISFASGLCKTAMLFSNCSASGTQVL